MVARWYIVHAYSNFEKKVADSIEEQARSKGLDHLFEKILVPTEKVVEVRRGRKVDSERKFFPGYVMVRADLTDEAYHLIKQAAEKIVPAVNIAHRYKSFSILLFHGGSRLNLPITHRTMNPDYSSVGAVGAYRDKTNCVDF